MITRFAAALVTLAFASLVHAQPSPFTQQPFKDVPKTHPNYTAIEYLRQNNVLRGYLDGTFLPKKRITRAEFVAILTNPYFLQGQRENDCLQKHFASGSALPFYRDIDRKSDAAPDICIATQRDIVHGYPDGTFQPDNSISFAEAAKISSNVLSISVRRDKESDERWYTAYVRRLAELHAIPTTIHSVGQTLTRAEMAEIVYRLKANITSLATMHEQDLGR